MKTTHLLYMFPISLGSVVSHYYVVERSVEAAVKGQAHAKNWHCVVCSCLVGKWSLQSHNVAHLAMIRGPMRGPVSGGVEVREVHGEETRRELLWLRGILESVYGPWGSQLILQPQEGGAITRTRQSREILSLLSPRSPLLKLMVSHLYQHCLCYQDSTLYAGILATK